MRLQLSCSLEVARVCQEEKVHDQAWMLLPPSLSQVSTGSVEDKVRGVCLHSCNIDPVCPMKRGEKRRLKNCKTRLKIDRSPVGDRWKI